MEQKQKQKLKIALLLTGQLRTFRMVKHFHLHTLLAPYDVDVFMSVNPDNNARAAQEIEEVVECYRPVRIYECTCSPEEMVAQSADPATMRNLIQTYPYAGTILRQYFVVQQAYHLLQEHQRETDVQYDLVMRLRFDQLLFMDSDRLSPLYDHQKKEFICTEEALSRAPQVAMAVPPLCLNWLPEEKGSKKLFVLGMGTYFDYPYVNDQFWYHAPSLTAIMAEFYRAIPGLAMERLQRGERRQGCFIESLLHAFLVKHEIQAEKTNIGGVFVREPE